MTTTAFRTLDRPTAYPVKPTRRLPPTPRWWADLVGFVAGLSLLIVTALWVHNHGVQQVRAGGPTMVTAIARLAGLLASDLLLIQVLLMARIPVVERAFGQDRLARWHRWTGFASINLMLFHIQWIVLGYAGSTHSNWFVQLKELVVSYPGMLLAAASTVMLLMVAVTSIRLARRRLRYESWHLLHLYAYLGVGLALPHQLWTGEDFADPLARAYWWNLYAAAAGSTVMHRLLAPVWRNLRHRLTVSHVVPEGPGVTSVYLSGRRLDRLRVRAGQFFLWRFLDGPGWTRAHPFSLSATPSGDQLRITVRDVGDGSARIATLRPGTRALIEGPFGKLTGDSYRGGPVVMLACGIGITPLLSLLGELPYLPGEATLIYRARSEAEVTFVNELDRFAEDRSVRVVYLLGPRAQQPSWLPRTLADQGHDDAAELRRIVPDIDRSQVYVCGPDGWADAVRTAARSAGVPAKNLHTEQFAW